MVDRLGEDLSRLVQAAPGIEHMINLGPVFGPFLDLVEVAVVRNQRIVSVFVRPIAHRTLCGIDCGPKGHSPKFAKRLCSAGRATGHDFEIAPALIVGSGAPGPAGDHPTPANGRRYYLLERFAGMTVAAF